MKMSAAINTGRALSFLLGLHVFLATGCAFEVENPDNPQPISPKRGTTSNNGGGDNASSPAKTTGSQPAANVPLPNINCNFSFSRGAAASSGKEGATVELTEASANDGSTLLLRTLSTSSFLEVKDILFSTGAFSSGFYTFEYHKPNGVTCYVRLNLEPTDIEQKLKISVTAAVPE